MGDITYRKNSRSLWTPENWADYFGWPVEQVLAYKAIVDSTFVPSIEPDTKTGKYSLNIKYFDVNSNGKNCLEPFVCGTSRHGGLLDALQDARNIIATLELSEFLAKKFGIHPKAIQMMVIR